jgi:hypothetical protein
MEDHASMPCRFFFSEKENEAKNMHKILLNYHQKRIDGIIFSNNEENLLAFLEH